MTMNENATVFSFIKVPLETYTVSGFPGTMGRIECPALLYEPVNFSFFVDAIPPQPALIDMFPIRINKDLVSCEEMSLTIEISNVNGLTSQASLARQSIFVTLGGYGAPILLVRSEDPTVGSSSLKMVASVPIILPGSRTLLVRYNDPVVTI